MSHKNGAFEQLCESLNPDEHDALQYISADRENAWLLPQQTLWRLMRSKLVDVVDGEIRLSNRGERVLNYRRETRRRALLEDLRATGVQSDVLAELLGSAGR